MDVAALLVFVQYVEDERLIADPITVSAVAMLLYDYVLTIYDEITLVWLKPWSHINILFFFVRYIPFAALYPMIANQLLLDVPTETCHNTYPALTWLVHSEISLAEAALMVRTWAAWRQNRYVGGGLAIVWIGVLITGCIVSENFVNSFVISQRLYDGFRGCFITSANSILTVNFIMLSCGEILVMTLMVISAYNSYKYGSVGKLSHIVYRDGILYYVYLLAAAIITLVIMYKPPGHVNDLREMVTPLQLVVYSILTSRMLMNIRNVAYMEPPSLVIESNIGELEMRPRVMSDSV